VKQWQKEKIKELKERLEQHLEAEAKKIPQGFNEFCERMLGLRLTNYQREAAELLGKHDSVALRWSRQSGKTHLLSAWLLHYALTHDNSQIVIVGPSWRQTKIPIGKMNGFLTRIPRGYFYKLQQTMVRLKNGSMIQALPCNPETVRGFTLDVVYMDEANWISHDEELYDAILFTLATTGGKFICSSTPGSTDSLFWKIFNRPQFSRFAKHHVTYERALQPNGPMRRKWLEDKRKEYEGDPWRWKRELEAEWAEDESVWIPLSLITKCIGSELEIWNFESLHKGRFFGGLDLGKEQDYSAFVVIEACDGKNILRHLKVWPLQTKYATVIGYVKTLVDRWESFEKIRVDVTGAGNYVVEDMQNGGIENVEGVNFTAQRKQEMASLLKQRLLSNAYVFPFCEIQVSPTKKLSYQAELNVERFELRKDGTYRFSHPENQHDDVFWATALALYATVEMQPEPFLAVIPRRANKLQRVRKDLAKRKVVGVTR
jgi:phage FluMu gp28-like protein